MGFERRTFKTTSGNNRYSQNLRDDDEEDEMTQLDGFGQEEPKKQE